MRTYLFLFFFLATFLANGQSRSTKGWIDFRSQHENKWLQIAPAKMGPNALPVPDMDYARVDTLSGIELGVHGHFMEGDNAINSFVSANWCVVSEKVQVEVWAFPGEYFNMSNEVRDERQIYYDDEGWIKSPGDIWISTYIQLIKDKKSLPDLVLNYTLKTTTGELKHGRYTDAPGHYFYLAAGKSWYPKGSFLTEIRLAALGGFYVWQTNKVEVAQDEGPLVELGLDLRHKTFSLANEIGGYKGDDAYAYIGVTGSNDPLVYRCRFMRNGKRILWKLEYQTGFNDYEYQTIRLGATYRFKL